MKYLLKSGVGVLALVMYLLACQSAGEKQLFSDEKTARIMADLYFADAATNGYVNTTKDSMAQVYYDQVFEIHGVTKADYEKNLHIIAQREEHMELVVKQAIKILNPKAETAKKEEE